MGLKRDYMVKTNKKIEVKCPFCGKLINSLYMSQQAVLVYKCIIYDGYLEHIREDEEYDNSFSDYMCPICNKRIVDNQDDALKFLSGAKK